MKMLLGPLRYVLFFTMSALIGAIPLATAGAVIGYFTTTASAGAHMGFYVALAAGIVSAFLQLPARWWENRFTGWLKAIGDYYTYKGTNYTAFLLIAAFFSPILSVPGLALGAGIGSILAYAGVLHMSAHAAMILGAEYGFAAGCLGAVARLFRWYIISRKIKRQPGYYGPFPSKIERAIYRWLCKCIIALSLGPMEVSIEDDSKFDGVFIYGGTHQSGLDFIIAAIIAWFNFRQITQVRQLGGWRGFMGAFGSAFAVPSIGGKSTGNTDAVIEACARMLAAHRFAVLLLYMQGMLVYDNVLRSAQWRTGWFRILCRAAEIILGRDFPNLEGEENWRKFAEIMDHIGVCAKALHYWDSSEGRGGAPLSSLWVATGYGDDQKGGATVRARRVRKLSSFITFPREATEDFNTWVLRNSRPATEDLRMWTEGALIQAKLLHAGMPVEVATKLTDSAFFDADRAALQRGSLERTLYEATTDQLRAVEWTWTAEELAKANGAARPTRLSEADVVLIKRQYPTEQLPGFVIALAGVALKRAKKLVASEQFRASSAEHGSVEAALEKLSKDELVAFGLKEEEALALKQNYLLCSCR